MNASPDPNDPSERAASEAPDDEPTSSLPFLDDFPEHEGLSRAVTAFENGNYAEVRKLCQKLLEHEQDADVRRAATELLRRIEPDRLVVAILWASFVLLGIVILWAYGRGR
jgi:hypothetical protein